MKRLRRAIGLSDYRNIGGAASGLESSVAPAASNRVNWLKILDALFSFDSRFIPREAVDASVPAPDMVCQAPPIPRARIQRSVTGDVSKMAKIAKTGDRKKAMDTSKSTDCPKCSKPTRIVKRVKDRERGVPGGVYISCSACEFFEKL